MLIHTTCQLGYNFKHIYARLKAHSHYLSIRSTLRKIFLSDQTISHTIRQLAICLNTIKIKSEVKAEFLRIKRFIQRCHANLGSLGLQRFLSDF